MSTLRHGDAIVVTRPIVLPYASIARGERAHVVDIDPENGGVVAQLDRPHPDLVPNRNMIFIAPDSEDVARLVPARTRYLTIGTMAACVALFSCLTVFENIKPAAAGAADLATKACAVDPLHLANLPITATVNDIDQGGADPD